MGYRLDVGGDMLTIRPLLDHVIMTNLLRDNINVEELSAPDDKYAVDSPRCFHTGSIPTGS